MSEPETAMRVDVTTVRVLDPDEWFTLRGKIVTKVECRGATCDLYGSKPKKDGNPSAVVGWVGFASQPNLMPDVVASTIDHHRARVEAANAWVEGL